MSNLGNREIMSKNLQYYMNLNNLSRKEVCSAIGVKYTTFTDWLNGNVYPRIDKIELMANYFGISKSDLVEEHKKKQPNITDSEYEYVKKIRLLDKYGYSAVMDTIDREYIRCSEQSGKNIEEPA